MMCEMAILEIRPEASDPKVSQSSSGVDLVSKLSGPKKNLHTKKKRIARSCGSSLRKSRDPRNYSTIEKCLKLRYNLHIFDST